MTILITGHSKLYGCGVCILTPPTWDAGYLSKSWSQFLMHFCMYMMNLKQKCWCWLENFRRSKYKAVFCGWIVDVFQILTSARTEVTCVVTLRSVRTQLEVMAVCVPEVIELRESASHVWVWHYSVCFVMQLTNDTCENWLSLALPSRHWWVPADTKPLCLPVS